jgi:hypothetical protein
MRTCTYLIALLCLLATNASAQDITGLWKGTLYNDTTQQFYRYEIAISEEKDKLTGFSHTWFILDDKQYYGVKKVKIRKQAGQILVEDAELISNNYPVSPAKNVRQLNILTLEIKDSLMFLTGPFSTNRTKEFRSLTGLINVQRQNDFWQSAIIPHLQELGLAKNLSFVKKEELAIAKKNEEKLQAEILITKNEDAKKNADKLQVEILIAKNEDAKRKREMEEVALANVVVNKKDIKTERIIIIKGEKENNTPIAVDKKIATVPTEVISPVGEPLANISVPANKVDNVKEKQDIKNNDATTLPPGAAQNVYTRNTELQQTVYFKSDSLQLSLFDNGEVDGDTVSVLMNGKILFSKERLSTNAVRKTISIDPSLDSIQLVMYAENLGSIPPNTGLLVVKDGKDIYEIRFSGDLKKNAAIVFKRKK